MKGHLVYAGIVVACTCMPVKADLYHVNIDVSAIVSLQIQFALYNNSGVAGDSWSLIDNITVGIPLIDFETGTLEGFDNSLNPSSVEVVAGSISGAGAFLMQLDEDPVFSPTITYRDIGIGGGTSLEFDLAFSGSDIPGQFGLDELVVSILDPSTLDPLLPGLTEGFGDVLALSADGCRSTNRVIIAPVPTIPAPGSEVIGATGLGFLVFLRRRIA